MTHCFVRQAPKLSLPADSGTEIDYDDLVEERSKGKQPQSDKKTIEELRNELASMTAAFADLKSLMQKRFDDDLADSSSDDEQATARASKSKQRKTVDDGYFGSYAENE